MHPAVECIKIISSSAKVHANTKLLSSRGYFNVSSVGCMKWLKPLSRVIFRKITLQYMVSTLLDWVI